IDTAYLLGAYISGRKVIPVRGARNATHVTIQLTDSEKADMARRKADADKFVDAVAALEKRFSAPWIPQALKRTLGQTARVSVVILALGAALAGVGFAAMYALPPVLSFLVSIAQASGTYLASPALLTTLGRIGTLM